MFKLTDNGVIRLADNAHIPAEPSNTDYVGYLKWVADGNLPDPADVPPPPTNAEAIAALLAESGETRLTIQMMIEVAEDKAKAMGAQLGMTPEASVAYAYSKNKAYRTCKDLEAAIRALETSP